MILTKKMKTRKRKAVKVLRRKRRQEKKKALYVRLPHVIRDKAEIEQLFTGDFKVNLPRQSARHCYVIFHDVEEKMKNLKAVQNTQINGKSVVVAPAIIRSEKRKKHQNKKIVIPPIKEDPKITKTLFVSNIKCGTKAQEIKDAFPESVAVKMLKPYSERSKAALVKMQNTQIAAEYLLKIRNRPVVRERRLRINPDTRTRRKKKKSDTLKIYDGESEMKEGITKNSNEAVDHIVLENKI